MALYDNHLTITVLSELQFSLMRAAHGRDRLCLHVLGSEALCLPGLVTRALLGRAPDLAPSSRDALGFCLLPFIPQMYCLDLLAS